MKPIFLLLTCIFLLSPAARGERFTSEPGDLFTDADSPGSCEAVSPVCEKWRSKLPARLARDFRTCNDAPSDGQSLAMACGKQLGHVAMNYVKAQGGRALLLQLTAKLGISGATTSFVLMTGAKAFAAWKAVQFMYKAFEADAKCFADHDFKRSILEPVAHFYPAEHLQIMVENRGCTDLGQFVVQKIQNVEQDIRERQRKQAEYEQYTRGRTIAPEILERRFPLDQRTLSEAQKVFLEKRARMERATPLFDAATEIVPCLKPEALVRTACGLVAELGWAYSSKGSFAPREDEAVPGGVDPELKKALLHEAGQ